MRFINKQEKEKNMNDGRVLWVDIAKGIGIILVVVGHLIDGYSLPGMYICSFHMPLFFFLSGLFMRKKISYIDLIRRTKQLLIPCLFFTFIFCLVKYYFFADSLSFLTKTLPGPLWFLTTLYLADLECRILCNYLNAGYLMLINLVLCFFCQYYCLELPYSLTSVFIASFFYLSGYLFNIRIKIQMGWVLLVSMICLPLLVFFFGLHTALSNNAITFVGVFAAFFGIAQVVSISMFLCNSNLINTCLSFVGRNSLVIMVTHMLFIELYCYYVEEFSPYIVYKVFQACFVFGMSIISIFVFRGKLSFLVGKN